MDALDHFTSFRFSHDGKERPVYRKGTGPAVVVMHEVPGITPEVARFGRHVADADAGFTVFMRSLFGRPGAEDTKAAGFLAMGRLCISREWSLLAADAASPVVDWLRALAAHAFHELGRAGLGQWACASPAISR